MTQLKIDMDKENSEVRRYRQIQRLSTQARHRILQRPPLQPREIARAAINATRQRNKIIINEEEHESDMQNTQCDTPANH